MNLQRLLAGPIRLWDEISKPVTRMMPASPATAVREVQLHENPDQCRFVLKHEQGIIIIDSPYQPIASLEAMRQEARARVRALTADEAAVVSATIYLTRSR